MAFEGVSIGISDSLPEGCQFGIRASDGGNNRVGQPGVRADVFRLLDGTEAPVSMD